MSADGQGELEPDVPRKNVVGLFCGAAFHDVVFARVSGCDVVRLYDWELRRLRLSRGTPQNYNSNKTPSFCVFLVSLFVLISFFETR